nr:TetR/AcrR family transcriptional regulator [Kineosporia mesophila]
MRSDAQDNRDKILEVAREVFATEGLDVSMREVARRAQVGPATLYRRFPTKEALVTQAFEEQMGACRDVVEEAVADPDPWRGFCTVIEKVFELHARDRGFTAAFMSAYPKALDFSKNRGEVLALIAGLAARARESGDLRPDFVVEDLVMVIMANGGIRAGSPAASVAASRRFAALAVEAFRAGGRAPLPPAVRLPLMPV